MDDVEVKIPSILKKEKPQLEKRLEELVLFEEKRKKLLQFIDSLMKGGKNVGDDELVRLGRDLKKNRYETLKKQGLV